MGALNQKVASFITHFRVITTHDARQTQNTTAFVTIWRISDNQILVDEFAHLLIKCLKLLATAGAAHDNRSRNLIQVVGVQGLAQLQHHIVRDIDSKRNRAHTSLLKPALHKSGGRRRCSNSANNSRNETITTRSAVNGALIRNLDRKTISRWPSNINLCRIGKNCASRVTILARDPPERQTVATIGRYVYLNDLFVQP